MKKIYMFGFFFSCLFVLNTQAQMFSDNFTGYAGGNLAGQNGWTKGGSGPDVTVDSISPLIYGGYNSGNGKYIVMPAGTATASRVYKTAVDTVANYSHTTFYYSFLLRLSATSSPSTNYFMSLGGSGTSTSYGAKVFAQSNVAGGFNLGLSKTSNTAVFGTTGLSYNTTYLVVVRYTFNNPGTVTPDFRDDVAYLWINPVSSAEPSVSSAECTVNVTTNPNDTDFDGFAPPPVSIGNFIWHNRGIANPVGAFDGVRVGRGTTSAAAWTSLNIGTLFPLITIAEARVDANADGIPDKWHSATNRDTVHIQGVVFTPNYQTSNRSYYIWDGTAGIATFKSGLLSPALLLGDKVDLVGFIDYFNALTEVTPLSDSSIIVLSDSNTVPTYQSITIPQFYANPESYEGELVAFKNLSKTSGAWPGTGSSVNLTFKNGSDSVIVRIDSDTDIDGKTEPVYPIDVVGVITQFSSAANNIGYQIQPRFYATDFLPAGSTPVELTSFTANYSGSKVNLNWVTATEKNNRGFEIQKKSNGTFETVAFVSGNGTTTEKHTYSYSDKDVKNGNYTYRLKQVDFNGSFEYSKVAEVEVVQPKVFALEQNYPNPFNPSTTINFSLAVDSKISLKLFNILGQEITTLINSSYTAGAHQFKFNASLLNSGVYFYKLEANGIDGSSYNSVRKMMLAK